MLDTAICNHSKVIKKGRVFDFITENITLPNGATLEMDIIRHPGAAAIVAMTDEGAVLMIRQYRYAVGGYIWEIPAGTLNPGEDPLRCAQRELTEETGYNSRNIEKIGEITPLPAYSDERIHLFLATELDAAAQKLDADELLTVHPLSLPQAFEMIRKGKIQDGKTITGLHLAWNRLNASRTVVD